MIREKRSGTGPVPAPGQSGFGLLETMMGLLVFVILALAGTKAFHGVVSNQRETAQIKALTDAVTVTAERLSALNVPALTAPGSGYLQWSAPEAIGSGEYRFRFRTVPRPTVGGSADTTVVGLEVETGTLVKGAFVPNRSFATLIAPHLNSKDALGDVSTAAEREREAANYASQLRQIADVDRAAVTDNQLRLNSYSCYNPEQCCDYMRQFFKDPTQVPQDGLEEKCHYRCAEAGNVSMADWKGFCKQDFCALAPWKTREDCCRAIADGTCKSGSACARVCLDCVGEDGSTCQAEGCHHRFKNLVDCDNNSFCDGTPLPDGYVPGIGNAKAMCALPDCQAAKGDCTDRTWVCCSSYWGPIASGEKPDPAFEICATISTKQECCERTVRVAHWTVRCGSDGRALSAAHDDKPGQWYCGMSGGDWDKACAASTGCANPSAPPGAPAGGCQLLDGTLRNDPQRSPATGERPQKQSRQTHGKVNGRPSKTGGGGPVISRDGRGGHDRQSSRRGGGSRNQRGGRE